MRLLSGFFLTYLESVCWKSINYSRRKHTRGNPQLECQTEPHCPWVMWNGYLLGLKLVKVMKIRNVLNASILLLGVLALLSSVKAQGGVQMGNSGKIADVQSPLDSESSFEVNLLVNGLVDQDGATSIRFITDHGPAFDTKRDFREDVWRQFETLKTSADIQTFDIDRSSSQIILVVVGISTDVLRKRVLDTFESVGIVCNSPLGLQEFGNSSPGQLPDIAGKENPSTEIANQSLKSSHTSQVTIAGKMQPDAQIQNSNGISQSYPFTIVAAGLTGNSETSALNLRVLEDGIENENGDKVVRFEKATIENFCDQLLLLKSDEEILQVEIDSNCSRLYVKLNGLTIEDFFAKVQHLM